MQPKATAIGPSSHVQNKQLPNIFGLPIKPVVATTKPTTDRESTEKPSMRQESNQIMKMTNQKQNDSKDAVKLAIAGNQEELKGIE